MAMRPNVVLILSDDQGYGDLGVYGNPAVHTPHLDALARQGVRLDQHYSGAPLCAPARAALLTGRYHQRTGALSVESNRGMDRIAPREATVADLFKAAGYATGMVGKWHNGAFDPRHHPQARGFDEFVGFLNGGMYYWDWILDRGGTPWRSDGRYLTDVFTDEAVDFLRRHRSEPFFLYLAYNAPHAPLEAPPEDVRPFAERGSFSDTVSTLYGMIRRLDAGVGRVMEALDALGLAENTILLFTSDNGPLLGGDYRRYNGPFRGAKNLVLEGGIRVPAMVRWPAGIPGGRVYRGMAHFTDWLPTLLAACGVDGRPALPPDGLNLLPALTGDAGRGPAHQAVLAAQPQPAGAQLQRGHARRRLEAGVAVPAGGALQVRRGQALVRAHVHGAALHHGHRADHAGAPGAGPATAGALQPGRRSR